MRGRLAAGDSGTVIPGIGIDSRTIRRGELFVAIRGERFDGAAFVADALRAGACGAVVARASALAGAPPAGVVIEVPDATVALQELGRYVRRAAATRVVAITGSAGKTTTKETAAEFLAARHTVYRNPGNLNNHIGLPLSLIELRARPDVAVVELGMNHAGEIRRLVALAEPDVRVWTNVGDAHLGFFDSPDAIADAKAEILEGANSASVLVANADDARVMARVPRFVGTTVTFGTGESATIRARDIDDLGIDGTRVHVVTPVGGARLHVGLPGRGNLLNVLAAVAVAQWGGVPLSEIVERAARLRAAPHRGEVVTLREGVTLVDDSYNSSPSALKQALGAIAADTRHARRVAVLGEMLELGAFATALHEECGRAAAAAGVHRLVAVGGPAAAALARAAAAAGLGAQATTYVATSPAAAQIAADVVRPGDLVLVKGSRGIRTDLVVDRLKAEWS